MTDRGADVPSVLHAAARGVVGALAMTGMRTFTLDVGMLDRTPPDAIVEQKAGGLLRRVPGGHRRAAIEALHYAYGAVGGVVFALLPQELRHRAWAGPAYGMVLWATYEVVLAPALGLGSFERQRPVEVAALAGDHLLYGLVLSEMRRRPQS